MNARELFTGRKYVLLDFDGPVCSVFAGYPAVSVARELVQIASACVRVPRDWWQIEDPLELLMRATAFSPVLTGELELALQRAELVATESATPTPGVEQVLNACARSERPVAIVSNNSQPAIDAYLHRLGIEPLIDHVEGRDAKDVRLMKPNPHLLIAALSALGGQAAQSLFVGDSVTDVEAATAAGMPCVGYANRTEKSHTLSANGAVCVLSNMADLAEFL